ncbi:MAG: hypothetical protein LC796_16160, partial [Acidobacteria bacterium]|nr:hypothetical protein [Acidobacteriota bacterium]
MIKRAPPRRDGCISSALFPDHLDSAGGRLARAVFRFCLKNRLVYGDRLLRPLDVGHIQGVLHAFEP